MRKLLFILLIICSIKNFAQIDTINIDKLNLKGNIKEVTEFTFKAIDKFGIIQKGEMVDDKFAIDDEYRKTNITYSFDEHTQQIEYKEYWNPTSIKNIKTYSYQNGHIYETSEKMLFSDATIKIREIFKYNTLGLMESCTRYRNNALFEKYLYTYDEENNITKELNINSSGEIDKETIYEREYLQGKEIYLKESNSDGEVNIKQIKYDHFGRLEREYVNYNNDFIRTIKYSYTDFNKPESIIECDDNGKSIVNTQYKYDDSCRPIEIKQIFSEGKPSITFITYEGTTIKESLSKYNGDKESKIINNGNIIKYQINNNEFQYEYIFDKEGNWIRITEFKNTVPTIIRERTILYHTKNMI